MKNKEPSFAWNKKKILFLIYNKTNFLVKYFESVITCRKTSSIIKTYIIHDSIIITCHFSLHTLVVVWHTSLPIFATVIRHDTHTHEYSSIIDANTLLEMHTSIFLQLYEIISFSMLSLFAYFNIKDHQLEKNSISK